MTHHLRHPVAACDVDAAGGADGRRKDEIVDALKAKRLAGAGLDVFEKEPLKVGHPLATLDNVILTAHTAGVDKQSRLDMAAAAAHAIITLLKGEWLPDGWVVNPEVKPAYLVRCGRG
jgi:phosphoglycerate dehydrogenase-like enzyme